MSWTVHIFPCRRGWYVRIAEAHEQNHEWENVLRPPQHNWHWFHTKLKCSLPLCCSYTSSCISVCASAITMVDPFSQQDGKISTLLHFVVTTTTADTYVHTQMYKHAHTVHLAAQYHYRSFFPIRTTHIFDSAHTWRGRENEQTIAHTNVACCIYTHTHEGIM